ncbi:MAG: metallophosphoesterase [Polyangiaceae bacterium]|nr:metallophosphoesterase [Polyangiaceae bacterium]
MPTSRHNLLVLSDVHLGSDLVQHCRPGAPLRSAASSRRDRDLAALLDWYRERPAEGRPWRLVIAGDLVDFVGMSVSGETSELVTEPNLDEQSHGLGGAVDHTLAKLRRVADHHRGVFAAMGRFVAAGNTLVVVRGNHDVDFHWEPVQAAFRAILREHGATHLDAIEFADWFYYEEGVVYVEHGHQYDDYCSYEHVLFPVVPTDPKRSARSLSDVLLRYVVRPTAGMHESGHDKADAIDYLRFGARLGARGILALGRRFLSAIAVALGIWRDHMSGAAAWVRNEHERKMAMLAEARHISLVKLQALAALQRPPITKSALRLLAGVMVDRVAVAAAGVVLAIWLLVARWTPALGVGLSLGTVALVALAVLWRRARGEIDASALLRERAARVSSVFPAAFIVMGHTHLPELSATRSSSAYVNVGAWAEDQLEEGEATSLPATRTHLVVQLVDGRPTAVLMQWDAETGPRRF